MSKKNYQCRFLPWDTDYFGVNSARVNLNGIVDKQDKKEIIEFSNSHDFVTISNLNNIKENNYWIASRTNAFLADINIQFIKNLLDNKGYKDHMTYVENYYPRNEQVLDIARRTFRYSRFFNDSRLPYEQARNIYLHWTDCAFEQENKYFVISEREGTIAGYILFSIKEENTVIELIAVDEKYQGQRVGKSLIETLEAFAITRGIRKIEVGTQINNILAANFYSKMGFTYVCCTSTYHWWNI